MGIDRINLGAGDHIVSLGPPRRGERVWMSLTPDSPLTYGYEEAGCYLDRQSLGRLLHWLQTGEALPRDDERIPEPFGGQPMTAALRWTAAVVAALAALGLAVLKWAPCPGCADEHGEAGE